MPQSFKALTTIMAWIMWFASLVMGFGTLIMGIIRGDLFDTATAPPMAYPALFAVTGLFVLVTAVVMLARKKME